MRFWGLVAGVIVVVFVAWKVLTRPPIQSVHFYSVKPFKRTDPDPCAGKEYCAVFYLAPWCPGSRAMVPQVVMLKERWRDSNKGVKVVVGNDKPDALAAMASQLGPSTYVADDNEFYKSLKSKTVPVAIITDASGAVLKYGRPAHYWVQDELR